MTPTPRTAKNTATVTEEPPSTAASRYQKLRSHLAELKLHAAAAALPAVLDQASAENLSLTVALERLLAVEVEASTARRLAGRLRFACLPTPATLDDFTSMRPPASTASSSTNWAPAVTSSRRPTFCSSARRAPGRRTCRWGWQGRQRMPGIGPTSPLPPIWQLGAIARRLRGAGPPPCGSTPAPPCW